MEIGSLLDLNLLKGQVHSFCRTVHVLLLLAKKKKISELKYFSCFAILRFSYYNNCNNYFCHGHVSTLKIPAKMRQHKKSLTYAQVGLRCVLVRSVPTLLPQNHRAVAQQEQPSPICKKGPPQSVTNMNMLR